MIQRSARVVHHVKGRIRVKLHDAKGNHRFLESVQQSLSPVAGVRNVDVNSATGSIVVHYDETMHPDFAQTLANHGKSVDLFSLEPAELSEVDAIANKLEREAQFLAQHSDVAKSAVNFVSQIDQALKQATNNTVDLKVLLPMGLAIYAFLELESDITTQCHSFFRLRVGIAFRTSLFQFWARALRLGNLAPCPQIARGLERRRLRFGSLQQATR